MSLFQVKVIGPWPGVVVINVANTQEKMDNMTVRQLKEKIAKGCPGKEGMRLFLFMCFSQFL